MPIVLAGLHYRAPPAPSTTARACLNALTVKCVSVLLGGGVWSGCNTSGRQSRGVRKIRCVDFLDAEKM
eukprot:6858399-Prymnesium_polylepis.1